MEKRNRRFAREDIIAIQELAEQLSSELDNDDLGFEGADDDVDTAPIIEDAPSEADDVMAAAEELLGTLPDDEPDPAITGCNNEAKEVLGEAEKLEQEIACKEETDNVLAEADELENEINSCIADEECPECGSSPCKCGSRFASEFAPGIEDEIGDEAHGGDPSVSDIVDNDIDVSTDKEVFGQNTDSEYVAKITARLDRVATALEKRGMKKMAFRVDQLSDRLEASIR